MIQNQNITAQSTGDSQNHRIQYFGLFDFKIMKTEIWKDIPEFEELYQASSEGRIKALDRVVVNKRGNKQFFNGLIRKQILSDNGYFRVRLSKNCKGRYYAAHRLVAMAFVPNFFNKPFINHKDGNKTNNCFSNLEWSTMKENTNHAYRTGLASNKGERHSRSILSDNDALLVRNSSEKSKELVKIFKVSAATINGIRSGRTYKHL